MPPDAPEPAGRDRLVGYACAALVVLVWSSFSLASRFSTRPGDGVRLTPWDLGALRYGVALCVGVGFWAAGAGRGLPWRRGAVLAVFGGFGFALPTYVGFSLAPAAHGALINAGALPFLVAIGLWLVAGEKWGRARQVSLGLLLAGFLLFGVEAYWHQKAPPGAWRGDLMFIAASASWATYTILARRWRPTPMQAVVAVGLWCGPIYLPVWWWALPSGLAAAPLHEVAFQAFFQGLVAVLLALTLFTKALALIGAGRLTMITAMVPGTTALLAIPLLGEPLGVLALSGLVLVCAAVALGVGRGVTRATSPSARDIPSRSCRSRPGS